MEKAIGNLSDDLIADAANLKKRKGKIISFYTISALAACLVAVIALTFILSGSKKPTLLVNGEPLEGSLAITENATANVRTADVLPLTITLEIELHKKSEISVSEGNLSVLSGEAYEDKGLSFEGNGTVKLLWNIDAPEEGKSYTLFINEETYATVSYNQGRNVWMISGQ